jgi:hypothetical protein
MAEVCQLLTKSCNLLSGYNLDGSWMDLILAKNLNILINTKNHLYMVFILKKQNI